MAQTQINGATQIKSGTITTTQLAAAAGITDGQLASQYLYANGSRAMTGNLGGGGFEATNWASPTASNSLATKSYVDGVAQGLDTKASVRAATIAAGTLASSFASGQVIDGVTLATNDRILIKNQSAGAENGIYVVTAGTPTRATDADNGTKLNASAYVFVEEGSQADTGWTLTNNGAITIGTTALVWTTFTGVGATTVTDGTLVKTGNDLKRAAITGDVGIPDGSNTATIASGVVTLTKMANLAANSVIGNLSGSTSVPAAVSATSAATASTVTTRDASANVRFNSVIENFQSIATSGGTTTLLVGSPRTTQFTGSSTQTVVTPDATTMVVGQQITITNRSSGNIQTNANGGGALQTMVPGSFLNLTLTNNGTAAGTWDAAYTAAGGSGSVTTVSVVSVNGLAGTVTNASTTPAISLSTSVVGLVKGNGTALSAAAAGTDYLAPSGRVTRETPSGSVNGSNTAFTLANTPTAGTEEVYLNGIQQEPGAGNDYTISGATITYLTAPISGDKIRVSYFK